MNLNILLVKLKRICLKDAEDKSKDIPSPSDIDKEQSVKEFNDWYEEVEKEYTVMKA